MTRALWRYPKRRALSERERVLQLLSRRRRSLLPLSPPLLLLFLHIYMCVPVAREDVWLSHAKKNKKSKTEERVKQRNRVARRVAKPVAERRFFADTARARRKREREREINTLKRRTNEEEEEEKDERV